MKPVEVPGVEMASSVEPREVYCEASKKQGSPLQVNVNWKLRNTKQMAWPSQMQLIPIMSSPTVRCNFDSKICQLQGMKSGELKLNIDIPAEFDSSSLVMVLKLKANKKVFVGPTLILYVKINSYDDDQEYEPNLSESNLEKMEQMLREVKRGKDAFNEPQLLNMGSVLLDEGYGDFERCMSVVRVLRGDIVRAREILSQLTYSEAKLQP